MLGVAFMATQLAGPRLVPAGSVVLDLLVAAEIAMLAVNSVLAGYLASYPNGPQVS